MGATIAAERQSATASRHGLPEFGFITYRNCIRGAFCLPRSDQPDRARNSRCERLLCRDGLGRRYAAVPSGRCVAAHFVCAASVARVDNQVP